MDFLIRRSEFSREKPNSKRIHYSKSKSLEYRFDRGKREGELSMQYFRVREGGRENKL